MKPRIIIIDYGMGNLRNVQKGFEKVGFEAKITNRSQDIKNAWAVVLPGVGAFRDCMQNLDNLGIIEPLIRAIEEGKPYLGICLGLQILFSESEEFGAKKGLGIIKGRVKKFLSDTEHKVPHMGWNTIEIIKDVPILKGIKSGDFFYFVHSFYVEPEEKGFISTLTDYGIKFASSIVKENVFATQFHPEKSQKKGLIILENFAKSIK